MLKRNNFLLTNFVDTCKACSQKEKKNPGILVIWWDVKCL